MATLERPRFRPLPGRRVEHQGRTFVALSDPLGAFAGSVLIPIESFERLVGRFDGRTTCDEVRGQIRRDSGVAILPGELETLVDSLDRAMVLDGPTFAAYARAYAEQPTRPAALAGRSYPADPSRLCADLARMFEHPDAAGHPAGGPVAGASRLRGIVCPHIDFGRGGPVYSRAYKELIERSDAEIFVVLGVAHQPCRHRFALTRKDFETPLGPAITDRAFVDRLATSAGPDLFEDELAHRTEHSIEFQAVLLRYLLGGRRDFAIVPILVGSFHDLMAGGAGPIDDPEVGRMIGALREAEAASGKKVAYIGGVDFCHVGPEFGDRDPVDDPTLGAVRAFDRALLDRAARVDPAGWFSVAAEVGNRWRVCGLAATYTMLHAIGPARGRLLRYDQAVDPSRSCCVTFAGVAFDAVDPAEVGTTED